MPTHTRFLITALLSLAACKGDGKPEPLASAPTATAKSTEATQQTPPVDDEATVLAGKPKQRVSLDRLGLSIDVPEGTTLTPPRDADEATRRANLKQGAFMVNVAAVDEYSTPDFAKAKEVYKSDKLVAWLRADETSTGWITFKEVVSSLHKSNRFEVGVRTQAGGKKWDCSISAPSKPLAELALAACQTLSAIADEKPTATKSAAATPAKKPAAKRVQLSGGAIQGALDKNVIATIVRRQSTKMRSCYERGLMKNPKLEVTVTTTFVIGGDGKVTSAAASAPDNELASCVGAVFRGLQFPAPADGKPVRASYPIRFAT